MSNKLKRVNYSIFLDIVNSPAERYAAGVMKEWVEQRRHLVDNPADAGALHESLHMHKSIYLAGMYLYMLSPSLAKSLADNLGESSINMEVISQQLRKNGLFPVTEQASVPASVPQGNAVDSDQLEAMVNAMAAASEQMKQQQAEQAAQLEASMQAMAQNLAQQQQINELKSLLNQQNAMLTRLAAQGVTTTAPATTDAQNDQDDPQVLSDKIASIQKVKSKGLF